MPLLRTAFHGAWLAVSTLALACSGSIDDAPQSTPPQNASPSTTSPSTTSPSTTSPSTSNTPSVSPENTASGASPSPSSTPPANPDTASPVPPGELSFEADIHPLLLASCGGCHGAGSLPNFASRDVQASYRIAVRESDDILQELEEGEMPLGSCGGGSPGASGCVSVADFELLSDWVEAGSPE